MVGQAVLRDYPLRLWVRQQEHTDAVMREFMLLLGAQEDDETATSAPAQLLELAEAFTTRFGGLISGISEDRQRALEAGKDRMDSVIPLVEGIPELIAWVQNVFTAVDEYCSRGDLLTLARPPEIVALSEWSLTELVRQYDGGEPIPWPGPF